MRTTMDQAGRIRLPEQFQALLGLKPGDEVSLDEWEGHWVIRPVQDQQGLAEEGRVLVHHGQSDGVDEAVDALRSDRLHELREGSPQ